MNCVLMLNWIVGNWTVHLYKNGFGIKLPAKVELSSNPNRQTNTHTHTHTHTYIYIYIYTYIYNPHYILCSIYRYLSVSDLSETNKMITELL